MTKEEFKEQYAAARLLISARYVSSQPAKRYCKERGQETVWDITYDYIMNSMPKAISYALFGRYGAVIYPIKDNKWAIHHNTTVFNRGKV